MAEFPLPLPFALLRPLADQVGPTDVGGPPAVPSPLEQVPLTSGNTLPGAQK